MYVHTVFCNACSISTGVYRQPVGPPELVVCRPGQRPARTESFLRLQVKLIRCQVDICDCLSNLQVMLNKLCMCLTFP